MARLTPVALLSEALAVLEGFLPQTLPGGKQPASRGCSGDHGCDRPVHSCSLICTINITRVSSSQAMSPTQWPSNRKAADCPQVQSEEQEAEGEGNVTRIPRRCCLPSPRLSFPGIHEALPENRRLTKQVIPQGRINKYQSRGLVILLPKLSLLLVQDL